MRSYLNYFKLNLITNLQYRAAAIAGISTQIFFGIVYVMVYLALYESNKGVNAPMNMQNLITYLWLGQAFFAMTYPFLKDKELLGMIKNGNLAYELVRPQNFYFKFYIKMLAERIISCLLRFSPILVLAFILPKPYKMALPISINNFIVFLLGLILSVLLISSLNILVHIITMFTIGDLGVINMYLITSELFMGSLVPLPFLPKILIKIGNFLPFRFIGDFPYRVYSGDIPLSEGKILLLFSLIWLIVIIIAGLIVSKIALKKAVIQGG